MDRKSKRIMFDWSPTKIQKMSEHFFRKRFFSPLFFELRVSIGQRQIYIIESENFFEREKKKVCAYVYKYARALCKNTPAILSLFLHEFISSFPPFSGKFDTPSNTTFYPSQNSGEEDGGKGRGRDRLSLQSQPHPSRKKKGKKRKRKRNKLFFHRRSQ